MGDLAAALEKLLAASEQPAPPVAPLAVAVESLPALAAPLEVVVLATPKRKPWRLDVQRDSNGEMSTIIATPLE